MRSRRLPMFVLPLALAGCIFGGGGERREPRRATPTGLAPARSAAPEDRETRLCLKRMTDRGFDFRSLPDRHFSGGCSAVGSVQLLDIGTPVTNLGAMRCGLAEAFSGWVRYGVVPAARQYLGSEVEKVESFGTYACRGTVGTGRATRLSEHAVSNAVDIAAFQLADGRRISVLDDWGGSDADAKAFLRAIHASACRRFGTVLGPGYNAAHRNHFHMDMSGSHFCR